LGLVLLLILALASLLKATLTDPPQNLPTLLLLAALFCPSELAGCAESHFFA
jgi:hypothetical protein